MATKRPDQLHLSVGPATGDTAENRKNSLNWLAAELGLKSISQLVIALAVAYQQRPYETREALKTVISKDGVL